MARRESVAVGGYYPTPSEITRRILCLLALGDITTRRNQRVVLDPCAGEGTVLADIRTRLDGGHMYGIEMEDSRHQVLARGNWSFTGGHNGYWQTLHGDFFHADTGKSFVDLLWLNPPYDTDREMKRLEERFLRRAQDTLVPDGILVFIVPGYALSASAQTLAKGFSDLQCWRFPDEDGLFDAFKQVVLIARRSPRPDADPAIVDLVMQWANDPTAIPQLPAQGEPIFHVPASGRSARPWTMASIDVAAIRETFHPWESERGEVSEVNPPVDLAARYHRTYPVASIPRATHLAAALAAGVFNGARVAPDDESTGLPPLLVKGVFDKEYRTIEEKTNKSGEKVAEVQVQHPKLQVTVLDLDRGTFHTVRPSADLPLLKEIEGMTLANLIDSYGESMMDAMRRACPVLHDPRRDPEIEPDLAAPLFPAQKSVLNTILRMRRENRSDGAIILGEIGSGKTRVALAAAHELGARRTLVVCPPHLLNTWIGETQAVLPGMTTMVLNSITDVEHFCASEGPTLGILSRERAKLGHGWETVAGSCPRCGAALGNTDFAIKRERCSATMFRPANEPAQWLHRNAHALLRLLPTHHTLRRLVGNTPHTKRMIERLVSAPRDWDGTLPEADTLLRLAKGDPEIATWLAWAVPGLALQLAANVDTLPWNGEALRKAILLALPPGTAFPPEEHKESTSYPSWNRIGLDVLVKHHAFVHGLPDGAKSYHWQEYEDGATFKKVKWASRHALGRLIDALTAASKFRQNACGEPLYQAVGEPQRYPLATWISQRHRNDFDMLIIDECHEFSSEDSAQSHAKARLEHGKAFRLLLTGSFVNGYADSAYNNLSAVSADFRATFGRDGRTQFVDRYGYWKRVVQDKDMEGEVVAFGSQTDRVQRTVRKAGMAPGVLPLFNLEWLLPVAATLQKTDLHLDLPQPTHATEQVSMSPEQARNYTYLLNKLLEQIRETKFVAGLAGKLWGALAHLPSYLDLAACGEYTIRWPENCPNVGGQEIVTVPGLNPGELLPKEEWMLATVQAQIDAGRPALVLGWHRDVLDRLLGILQTHGFEDAIYLDATKVPTGKRQAWIDKNVVRPNRSVMVCNPVTIQTGLNNLVHFKTQVWMENPACNPHVFRQAQGRIDRIGQTLPPHFVFPLYEDSAQEQLHRLLLHKVAVALGVDGLDPEAALRAAGVEDDGFQGLSVGRALYRMIVGD